MQINTFVNIRFINYTSNNLTYFENRLGMCILILAFYICLINPDNLCVTSISHNVKRTHCCSNKKNILRFISVKQNALKYEDYVQLSCRL